MNVFGCYRLEFSWGNVAWGEEEDDEVEMREETEVEEEENGIVRKSWWKYAFTNTKWPQIAWKSYLRVIYELSQTSVLSCVCLMA